MSSSKHTPGPWFADSIGRIWRRSPSDLYEYGGGVAGDKPVATVIKVWHGEEEAGFPVEANARLIAAAPELLEALKSFISLYGTDDATAWQFVRDKAVTAINKATGDQP